MKERDGEIDKMKERNEMAKMGKYSVIYEHMSCASILHIVSNIQTLVHTFLCVFLSFFCWYTYSLVYLLTYLLLSVLACSILLHFRVLFYLEHEGSLQDAIIEYKQTHTIPYAHTHGSTFVMHKYGVVNTHLMPAYLCYDFKQTCE